MSTGNANFELLRFEFDRATNKIYCEDIQLKNIWTVLKPNPGIYIQTAYTSTGSGQC